MPFTWPSERPSARARNSSTNVSSPSPRTTTSKTLVARTCSGTAVPCSPPSTRSARGNVSRMAVATRWVSGHSVLNMHDTPMTSASAGMRRTVSSTVRPCIMKSSRSGYGDTASSASPVASITRQAKPASRAAAAT